MSEDGDSGVSEYEAVYDENGVDRSLVRWMLSLTPAERLACAESMRDLAERARRDAASLPRLIAIKEKLTRPKDQLMLMILRATLEERTKGQR